MMRLLRRAALALGFALAAVPAIAAGSIPIALQQNVDVNGRPLAGCLLYIFQVGTVATPQNAFSDFGLSTALPNPIQCDQTGRLPMFYLADGAVHVRLTDSSGLVQFDYPTMQVLGPSSGGGGGGGSVDPTTVASTGDVKFRLTTETLTGWVKLNAQTIGSATSGATGRANSDTQNLFIYTWTNCPDAHCPVLGGRGATALADFNANKQITLLDCRSRICGVGLDDMGNVAAGRLLSSNVTSGGGDGVTTAQATGGESNHTLSTAELPVVTPSGTVGVPGVTVKVRQNSTVGAGAWNVALDGGGETGTQSSGGIITMSAPSFTGTPFGGGGAHNNMPPFILGTYYMKL
jgi:hypothetical protein